MTEYKFDNTGRLLRQWWYCDHCDVSFWRYIETCPVCKEDCIPILEKNLYDNNSGTLQNFKGVWARLKPSKTFQFEWTLEPIKKEKQNEL